MSHDPSKRRTNLRKHNIDLPGCMEAFDGPMLTREDGREDYGEQRLVRPNPMNEKRTTERTRNTDVPYDPKSKADTQKYWEGATAHQGVAEFRAKRGRPTKAAEDRKEQISLRVDKEVLEWYRAQGAGWQTRMNAVLKAFRDAAL